MRLSPELVADIKAGVEQALATIGAGGKYVWLRTPEHKVLVEAKQAGMTIVVTVALDNTELS